MLLKVLILFVPKNNQTDSKNPTKQKIFEIILGKIDNSMTKFGKGNMNVFFLNFGNFIERKYAAE